MAADERSAQARARAARVQAEKERLGEVAVQLETHVVAARESRDAGDLEEAIQKVCGREGGGAW